jgi:4-carboxymuconolactone decarboxylase
MRYNLSCSALRETIIITARDQEPVWFYAHARLARQAGVSEHHSGHCARHGAARSKMKSWRYVHELLRNHKISDATFNAVRDRFGMQKTLEITGLIGHYLLVGQILAAFAVDLPEGAKPEIPESPRDKGRVHVTFTLTSPRGRGKRSRDGVDTC